MGVAATIEGLVLVGTVVPVTPMLVWLGAALAGGGTEPWPLLWAVGGAAVGNAISFEFGRWIGIDGVTRIAILARAKESMGPMFGRGGGAAILLSRLIGAAGLISFAAGLGQMPRAAFYARSFWANILWVSAMAGAGYLAALGWRDLVPRFRAPALLGLVVVIGLLLAGWAVSCWTRRGRTGAKASAA